MKNKVLKGIILIISGVMIFGLTGCENKQAQKTDAPEMVEQKASKTQKKQDIDFAKDATETEISELLIDFYSNYEETKKPLEYINKKIGKGKKLNNYAYLTINGKSIVVYTDNSKKEKLVTGKINDNGKINWDN